MSPSQWFYASERTTQIYHCGGGFANFCTNVGHVSSDVGQLSKIGMFVEGVGIHLMLKTGHKSYIWYDSGIKCMVMV